MFYEMIMSTGIVFIIFYFCYKIIEVLSHRKERMAMIEKMAQHPDVATRMFENRIEVTKSPYNWLKPACLVIGLGIGCILAFMVMRNWPVHSMEDGFIALIIFGLPLICGGVGMLSGFFMERTLRKSDEKRR